jgi:hypothetical protein
VRYRFSEICRAMRRNSIDGSGVAQDAKDELCRLTYDFYEGILQLPDAGAARLRPYMFAAHK